MRYADIKLLALGLGIGVPIIGGILTFAFSVPKNNTSSELSVAVQSSPIILTLTNTPTIGPTPTFTSTPTYVPLTSVFISSTPSLTQTSSPTATDEFIENGEMLITGPLPRSQQIALKKESLKYIAPTYAESREIVKLIESVAFIDPSVVCGPLSIAMLQDANILNHNVAPYDFFLLNPSANHDRNILEQAFPEEFFTDTRYEIRLDKVDWRAYPLFPGDFLYIYGGSGGNFEHMLVVTRVDDGGRAYSVTNFNTMGGFIIDEVMLYDPYRANTGIFHMWTERPDALLGSTGFTGFEVWRKKEE